MRRWMTPFLGAKGTVVIAVLSAGCAGRGDDVGGGETTSYAQDAITVPFSLPIPVGLHPGKLVLGATGTIRVNDRAEILVPSFGIPFGDIAAMGPGGETNIGVDARVSRIWARHSILFRHPANVSFYKTSATVQSQGTTMFADPDENREQVTIRQDPIWTASFTVPTNQAYVSIEPGYTAAITPGDRGNYTVKGTLTLNGGGTYSFASFDLEPTGVVQLSDPANTTVVVGSNLILHTQPGAPLFGANGLVFAYLGTSAAQVERGFKGDLFLAPQADISVKSHSFANFYGKNITVFEGIRVTGVPVLGPRAVGLLLPTESVTGLGVMGSGFPGGDEMASALLPPAFAPQCSSATPIALVSHHSRSVVRANVNLPGGAFLNVQDITPGFPGDPSACIPTVFPNFFQIEPWLAPLYPSTVPDPNAIAYYGPSLTDNLIARLPGGRALQVGLTSRVCADPPGPLAAGCPAMMLEAAACNPFLSPNVCAYGGGVPADANTDKNCLCVDPEGDEVTAGAAFTPVWVCRTRRIEGGALAVRMSSDCGSGWNSGALDLYQLGVTALPPNPPDGLRNVDRPDLYVNPFDDRVFVSANWGPGFAITQNVVVEGRPKSAMNPQTMQWSVFRNDASSVAYAPRVMTTVRDDRALLSLSPRTYGPFVHFASAYCINERPMLNVQTPFGPRQWDLAGTNAAPEALCRQVPKGTNGMPFFGIHFGPSIAAISSSPPRFLIAYSGKTDTDFERTNLYEVTLRSAGGYAAAPEIEPLATFVTGAPPNGHVIFPQLVQADHLAGSDLGFDEPVILRIASVVGDTVKEHAFGIYSGLIGPSHLLTTWSLASAFPGQVCSDSIDFECFVGDYRYGSLMDKSGATLRFFVPWIGGNPGGAVSTSIQAAVFNVSP